MKSDSLKSLAVALNKVQSQVKAAVKDTENTFFHAKYASLASVWAACREALTDNGFAVVQTTGFSGDKFVLITTLIHSSGEFISGEYLVNPVKNDPQQLGSAITYSRRYALAAIVGVTTEDDDAEATVDRAPAQREVARPAVGGNKRIITEAQGRRLYAIWKSSGLKDEEVFAHIKEKYGFDSTRDITSDVYEAIVAWAQGAPV